MRHLLNVYCTINQSKVVHYAILVYGQRHKYEHFRQIATDRDDNIIDIVKE